MKSTLAAVLAVFSVALAWNDSQAFTLSFPTSNFTDTVHVYEDVIVPINETLVIPVGKVYMFHGQHAIIAHGNIKALGTVGQPIVFTMADTTGFHIDSIADGGWKGIRILAPDIKADSSIFEHCVFEFAKASGEEDSLNGGAIYAKDNELLRFSNCHFQYNYSYISGAGVFLMNSAALFENCSFTGNYAGHAIEPWGYGGGICLMYSVADVKDCLFENNYSSGIGGGISADYSDLKIERSIFKGNFSALGGALGILRTNTKRSISNCLFAHNACVFFGGAMALIGASPVLFNNTIVYNNSYAYGGGLYFNQTSLAEFYNCIIAHNQAAAEYSHQTFIFESTCAPTFQNCVFQGGLEGIYGTPTYTFNGIYKDNIETDPMLLMEGEHPYQITAQSPCLDYGIENPDLFTLPTTDLIGNPRIQGLAVDLGAYESPFTLNLPLFRQNNALSLYPNPVQDFASLKFHLNGSEQVSIDLLDIRGRLLNTLYLGQLAAGEKEIEAGILTNGLKPGLYLLRLNTGNTSHAVRFIKE